jgi:hypothetical protein
VAGALVLGYSTILVTSPSPENLTTFFQFVILGLKKLNFMETIDYTVVRSTLPSFNNSVVSVCVSRSSHRQIVSYFVPSSYGLVAQADLVVVDEAAAIPLPIIRRIVEACRTGDGVGVSKGAATASLSSPSSSSGSFVPNSQPVFGGSANNALLFVSSTVCGYEGTVCQMCSLLSVVFCVPIFYFIYFIFFF